MNLYKWLWTKIGGRQWTYIMRDFYHKYEYFIILGFLTVGYFIHPIVSTKLFLVILGVLTVGYILGHLFWGKKWIEGQKGS